MDVRERRGPVRPLSRFRSLEANDASQRAFSLARWTDASAYEACREVVAAAHHQGFHGLVAPAATELGVTLALFSDRLPG